VDEGKRSDRATVVGWLGVCFGDRNPICRVAWEKEILIRLLGGELGDLIWDVGVGRTRQVQGRTQLPQAMSGSRWNVGTIQRRKLSYEDHFTRTNQMIHVTIHTRGTLHDSCSLKQRS
jgi:hypothetical protein